MRSNAATVREASTESGEPNGAPDGGGGTASAGRRLAVRAITIVVSLVVAVAFAEVGLRLVVPPRTKHHVFPPRTHHVFHPPRQIFADFPPESRFTVNSLGLRGPEMGRDDEELRILAIGGSTTECMLHDDEKTWTRRVGDLLTQGATGKRAWSGHAGRSGLNSGDHVLHAKYLLKELPRIDVVLMLVGVNDVTVALGAPDKYEPMPTNLEPELQEKALRRAFSRVPGRLEDAWDYDAPWFRQSQIYQLVRHVRRQRSRDLAAHNLAIDDSGRALVRWREHRQKAGRYLDEAPDLAKALATYRQNLETIAALTAEAGARLVMMTQPTIWRADLSADEQKQLWMGGVGEFQREPGHDYYTPRALAEVMRRFNDVLLSVCKDRGLSCVDLAAVVPKTSKYFYDDCHVGQTAAELIATTIADHLRREPPFAAP